MLNFEKCLQICVFDMYNFEKNVIMDTETRSTTSYTYLYNLNVKSNVLIWGHQQQVGCCHAATKLSSRLHSLSPRLRYSHQDFANTGIVRGGPPHPTKPCWPPLWGILDPPLRWWRKMRKLVLWYKRTTYRESTEVVLRCDLLVAAGKPRCFIVSNTWCWGNVGPPSTPLYLH